MIVAEQFDIIILQGMAWYGKLWQVLKYENKSYERNIAMNTKNKKQQLQETLQNMGYSLIKSTARKWSYDNQLGYMIIDISNNACIAGNRFDLSLEDVKAFLVE